ncbi:OsmC family protein [Candidatus Acetothermia bacterium]|nr:OsmC family protein [Candidatus Acetothermia bacterium]MCI2427854.1 OsmC family protein [Candidatus Acetothermia bacterium]MCI2428843.1 OsmC family protein [Candidatus Acetothermia bacterium]
MGETRIHLIEGMQFVGTGSSGHSVLMDASLKVSGGKDSAARPVDLLLIALGGCTGMDVISILRKMKTEPAAFSIKIDDERAEDYPHVVTKVHITYYVTNDVPEENLKKAIDLSLSKYCPIANTIAGVTKITSSYEIGTNLRG